jgi:hypothetical protein
MIPIINRTLSNPKTPIQEKRKEFLSPSSQIEPFGYGGDEVFKTPGSPLVSAVHIAAKKVALKRKFDSEFSSISFDCQEIDSPPRVNKNIANEVFSKDVCDTQSSEDDENDCFFVNCATVRAFVEEKWNPNITSTSRTFETDTVWNDFCVWGEIWSTENPMIVLQNERKSLQIMADGLYKIKLSLDEDYHKSDEVYLVLSECEQVSKQPKTKDVKIIPSTIDGHYKPPKIIPAKCLLDNEAVYLSLRRSDRLQLLHMKNTKDEGKEQLESNPWFASSSENRDDVYPSLQIIKIV